MSQPKSKHQPKLSITQAREASDDLTKHLKVAQRFKEVDALTDEKEIRASLHTHRTEVTRIIDSQDDQKAMARAVAATVGLRLAELCAAVPAGVSVRNVARENHIPFVEAERLRIVGTRVSPAVQRDAMQAAQKHGLDVPVADLDSLAKLKPAQQRQAIAKLADVPTMREAVAAVCPTFTPKAPVIPAKPADVVPKAWRDYQVRVLQVVADAIKLRELVTACIKGSCDKASSDRVLAQQAKVEASAKALGAP